MDEVKCQWLEAAGFRVGYTTEFLEFSPQKVAFIEFKFSLRKRFDILTFFWKDGNSIVRFTAK